MSLMKSMGVGVRSRNVAEVFCKDRFRQQAHTMGMGSAFVVDLTTGWDVDVPSQRHKVEKLILSAGLNGITDEIDKRGAFATVWKQLGGWRNESAIAVPVHGEMVCVKLNS